MSLDWLIIGGGIHGVHIAARLLGESGFNADQIAILDPGERLLARWRQCTAVTGMRHLRSPVVHHLGLGPWALRRFAGKRKNRETGLFAAPYERPSLELFNRHSAQVVATYGLSDRHIRDRAVDCSIDCDGVTVHTASGLALNTRHVVLAIGAGERLTWPEWAPKQHPRVTHLFETGVAEEWPREERPETVAVVGGGISAVQVSLRLASEGHRAWLVSRHGLRKHQFDSDPGWLGPKLMAAFGHVRDLGRRRQLIEGARHRGSVPPSLCHALRRAIAREQVHWSEAEVAQLTAESDSLRLQLSNSEEILADRVLLATGFARHRPGGPMLDELIASASLPCAQCGFPVVDSNLRWHPRIYVTGPLAELELGPVARNIAGAQRAGDRILDSLVA